MRASVQGPGRRDWPPINKFSSTVSDGKSLRPSGTSAMPRPSDIEGRCTGDRCTVEYNLASAGTHQASNAFQKRAFSGAIGADHSDHLASSDV